MQYLYLYQQPYTKEWSGAGLGLYETPMSLKQWAKVWNSEVWTDEIEVMDGTDITPILRLYERNKGQEVKISELMRIHGVVSIKSNRFYTKKEVTE